MASIVSVSAGCAGCLCVWMCSVFPALSPRLSAAGVEVCVLMFSSVLCPVSAGSSATRGRSESRGTWPHCFQPPPSTRLTPHPLPNPSHHHHQLSLLITAAWKPPCFCFIKSGFFFLKLCSRWYFCSFPLCPQRVRSEPGCRVPPLQPADVRPPSCCWSDKKPLMKQQSVPVTLKDFFSTLYLPSSSSSSSSLISSRLPVLLPAYTFGKSSSFSSAFLPLLLPLVYVQEILISTTCSTAPFQRDTDTVRGRRRRRRVRGRGERADPRWPQW